MRLRGWHPPSAGEAPPQRLGMVLAAASLGMFVTNLDFFALNLALPDMARDLDVSTTDMQWVISGYLLALGAFLIPGGRLGDILGRRRMLIVGLAIFAVASAACAAAPSAGVVIGFRLVQGIGAAILFPLCIAVVTNAYPENLRKRAIGNLYGLAAVATAAGPFVGGGLTEALGWRYVLAINVPVALLAIALARKAVAESRDESVPRRIDVTGLVAVVAGITALTFGIDRGDAWGWASATTLGMIAGGIAILALFISIERRARYPLLDLSLFRNVPYVAVTLAGMVGNIALCVTVFAATLYLQQVDGYSPATAGLIFLAGSGAEAISGPLSGRLGERFDIPALMAVAIAVGALGIIVIAAGPGLADYLPGLAAFGLGYGLSWSLTSVGTQTVVPTAQAGAASGLTLTLVVGGGGLCVAIAASLIEVLSSGASQGEAIEEVLRYTAIASVIAGVGLAAFARWARGESPASVPAGQ